MEGQRQAFVEASLAAVEQARRADGCRDFVVAADPLEGDRVNVYEEWASEEQLLAFRGEGPGEDLSALIVKADVTQFTATRNKP